MERKSRKNHVIIFRLNDENLDKLNTICRISGVSRTDFFTSSIANKYDYLRKKYLNESETE